MADIIADFANKNASELMSQGTQAFNLRDYATAAQAFSLASSKFAEMHGEKGDDLGLVYYYYGKSLLELYREQSEPLGDAVTKKLDDEASDSSEEGDEEEVNGDGKVAAAAADGGAEPAEGNTGADAEPGGSAEKADGESTEEQDDDASDLQVAWEVLEMAKLIFEKRGDEGKKQLANTLVLLGEVSLESENFESAVNDIEHGLELMKSMPEQYYERELAEVHYKLGMALSMNSKVDEAIESYERSLELLRQRIKTLGGTDEAELKEIKELIPELEEKIADVKSFKDEAFKMLTAGLASEKKETTTFKGDASSTAKANDISHLVKKKRNLEDIVADKETEAMNPAKKPTP